MADPATPPVPGTLESEVPAFKPLAFAIAYRMVGSVAETEDIVQEAFLRLHRARQEASWWSRPRPTWRPTTRLAIDHLRSARVRRESYVGSGCPSPSSRKGSPRARQTDRVGVDGLLLILGALSPVERAVFLLREVFDYEYAEIAQIVEKSEDNCRQIFARAKRHIDAGRTRFEASPAKRDEIADRFFAACRSGELEGLVQLLAADAAFYGDGGGKVAAVTRPVTGPERVARLMAGLFGKFFTGGLRLVRVQVNGQPGAKIMEADGRVVSVLALDVADGVVRCVRSVANPDKLGHLGPVSDLLTWPLRPRDERPPGSR